MHFARALFTVSGLTIVSRVAGFLRDTLTAMLLGAGPMADAYFVAQRLPNLFRSLFAEGAFAAAFVPLYAAEDKRMGREAAQRFAGEALALLLAVLIPFSLLLMVFMPWIIQLLAPGFMENHEKFAATVRFSRITFPYLTLISITALQGGVLNALGKFGPAAAAPIALNIVLIIALSLTRVFDWQVGETLAWAMMVAGAAQALWLAWSCRRAAVAIPLLWPRLTTASVRLFKQVGPGAIGAGAAQINLLLSTILASLLPTGAVSYLFYADRLNQLPLGIVGIAVATTLLPLLSRHTESGDDDKVRHYISRAIEFCLALGIPATIGLALAASPIISTLFEHGEFSRTDTVETAKALAAYALGIPAFLLVKVFSARFFASHDTRTPVKIALVTMAVNVVCALALLEPLQHVGIALATSIATWINAVLLFMALRRNGEKFGDEKLAYRLPRLVLCAIGMSLVTVLATHALEDWFIGGHVGRSVIGLTLIIVPSCLVYAALLQVTGAMRLSEAIGIMRRQG